MPFRRTFIAVFDLEEYQLEPEAYVLKVVERINSSALIDALLVLPFGKVTSLMVYLDEWAKRVKGFFYTFARICG